MMRHASILRWLWASTLAAGLLTLLEGLHMARYAPVVFSHLSGGLIVLVQIFALCFACALPAAGVGVAVGPWLHRRFDQLTPVNVLSAAVGLSAALAGLVPLRHLLGQGQSRSFPLHIDHLLWLATLVVLVLALVLALALRAGLSRVPRLKALGAPHGTTGLIIPVVALALTGAAAHELYAIHLDQTLPWLAVLGATGLTLSLGALPVARHRPLAWRPWLLVLLPLLALAAAGHTLSPHARYALFQHAPMGGALADRLFILWDRDGAAVQVQRAPNAPNAAATPEATPTDASGLLAGCRPTLDKPSVLLLTVDALRYDALNARAMPNLSRFAERTTRFERAYAASGYTEYAFLSFFAGLPLSDMLRDNPLVRDDSCAPPTLPEKFQAAGYHTAVFSHVILPAAAFRGFASPNPYTYPLDANTVDEFGEHGPLRSAQMTRSIISFVEAQARQPYFLWAHYTDLHAPYHNPPKPLAESVLPDTAYEQMALYVDHHLGRLLAWLSQRDGATNTIIVITADHGEELMQNGKEGHGVSVGMHTLHVPLLMWIPGCPPRQVAHPSSLIDVGRTLLALSGIADEGPTLRLHAEPLRPVVSEIFHRRSRGHRWLRSFVYGDYQLAVDVIHGGRMLFHLGEDPAQRYNRYDKAPDVAQVLESRYEDWSQRPAVDAAACVPGVDRDGPQGFVFGRF